MTNLTPLQQAEQVLAKIGQALKSTALWEDLQVNHNEELGPATRLCDVKVKSRSVPGYKTLLYKFWAKAAGEKSGCFVSRDDAPKSFSLRTMNRLGFAKSIPLLAEAFDGEYVQFDEVFHSWYWDRDVPRANGQPTHRTTYKFHILLNAEKPFNAKKWLKEVMKDICASTDERADIEPFEYVEDHFGKRACFSYRPTSNGVILEFDSLKDAEAVVAKLYTDCKPVISKPKKNTATSVTLTYPC